MKTDRIAIIGRGFAGWHADGLTHEGHRFSASGGDLLSRPWHDESVPGYLESAPAGTPVYDASDADRDAFVRFVIAGPVIDAGLPSGTVTALTEWPYTPTAPVPLDSHPPIGPLSHVAPDAFVRLLFHAVPGVRFGVVKGRGKTRRVEWDDGTATHYA